MFRERVRIGTANPDFQRSSYGEGAASGSRSVQRCRKNFGGNYGVWQWKAHNRTQEVGSLAAYAVCSPAETAAGGRTS
jgi:hypothetical protein